VYDVQITRKDRRTAIKVFVVEVFFFEDTFIQYDSALVLLHVIGNIEKLLE